uniref:Ubiquitinyl hydrolase 1 n=1 Tax=Ascaris lumbricoides TaxID=6252 RepID=A0A0M3IAB6_ASCLU
MYFYKLLGLKYELVNSVREPMSVPSLNERSHFNTTMRLCFQNFASGDLDLGEEPDRGCKSSLEKENMEATLEVY